MSTTQQQQQHLNNIDNDPFPVFTPRSAMMNGRSPLQPIQQQSSTFNTFTHQSPYGTNSSSNNRFNNSNNLMRSPNHNMSLQHHQTRLLQQQQQQQQHNYVQLQNMVQNISLTTPLNGIANTKLHTPSNTPPPPIQAPTLVNSSHQTLTVSTTNGHHNHQHAHRKLFPSINSPHNHLSNGHHFNNHTQDQENNIDGIQMSSSTGTNGTTNTSTSGSIDLTLNRITPPDLSQIFHMKRSDSYFMSDELKNELTRRNLLLLSQSSNADIGLLLPPIVKDYHNLVPLDAQQLNIDHKSRTFSYQTISYKANHIKNSQVYYLKRILGFRYVNQRCNELIDAWKKIQHANIVQLRDVFGTKEFNGEHSIVFVYDYYPGQDTLQTRLYQSQNTNNLKGWANPYNLEGVARPYSAGKGKISLNSTRALGLLSEQLIWDYVIQLVTILRTIHSNNLACRIMNPSRILIDHKSRLRLSGCGVFDILDFDNASNGSTQLQQDDLIDFGRLVLAIACNSLVAIQKEHLNTSIDIVTRNFSSDLRNLILHFITPSTNGTSRKNINDAMSFIGSRIFTTLDNAYTRGDIIENELCKEIDNGRLFKLITKFNIILERQDLNGDWGETGDRYMLKLFRDYIFHQVNSNAQPWIDMSHIVQCLNKFDAGTHDKICLMSSDSQNIMIVSYNQLKKCFDKVFSEITGTHTSSSNIKM